MEPPQKRHRPSPPTGQNNNEQQEDFISFSSTTTADDPTSKATRYGYNSRHSPPLNAPAGPRSTHHHNNRSPRNDPRHIKDRPKSSHPLPNHTPWLLIKTKYNRRFVHNPSTGESYWHVPPEVLSGVLEFERLEVLEREKEGNARWAEEQLRVQRAEANGGGGGSDEGGAGRARRRRSESLQREDEEAMMAELAAEAERKEMDDANEVVKEVAPLKAVAEQSGDGPAGRELGYGSDSSYEEVEVTDSEGEEDEDSGMQRRSGSDGGAELMVQSGDEDVGPVEFGEDDIAWQLAAMNEDDDPDPHLDADDNDYEDDIDADLSHEKAAQIFREMLNDHNISPFTPWDKLLSHDTQDSIVLDDRYTVLPNTRTRKQVWEAWVKDTAAEVAERRAKMEKEDPRVPYLAFLSENATPKLYWPEFKRKFKKEAVMNDRRLPDKEKEKLYRDHIARLKLPESSRKADLITLLTTIPLDSLNKFATLDALPQQLLSHLHFISLPTSTRDPIISAHIASLPAAPSNGEIVQASKGEEAKREQKRKQAEALAARERQVEEARRKAEKAERWAKRDLREGEREVREAMNVGRRGGLSSL